MSTQSPLISGPTWPPVTPSLREAIDAYLKNGGSISVPGREGPARDIETWFEQRHPGRDTQAMSSGTMASRHLNAVSPK